MTQPLFPETRAPDPPEASRAPEGARRDDPSTTYETPAASLLEAPVADDAHRYAYVAPPVGPTAWRPCVTCGAAVAWSLNVAGARLLVETDGTPHVHACARPT